MPGLSLATDKKLRRKRTYACSLKENGTEDSQRKSKQLRLSDFISSSKASRSNSTSPPSMVETSAAPPSLPAVSIPDASIHGHASIHGQPLDPCFSSPSPAPGTVPSGPGGAFPSPPPYCAGASHLSKICHISAESLILVLGKINSIESKLESIQDLLSSRQERLSQVNLGKASSSTAFPTRTHDSSKTNKTTSSQHPSRSRSRFLLPFQVVFNVPHIDAALWSNKGKILNSLSTLLNCHTSSIDLDYFYYLPSTSLHKRILLSFHSTDLPSKTFRGSHRLRSFGLIPARVFKDPTPRIITKKRRLSSPITSSLRPNNLPSQSCYQEGPPNPPNPQRDDLLVLQNLLTELMAPVRSFNSNALIPSTFDHSQQTIGASSTLPKDSGSLPVSKDVILAPLTHHLSSPSNCSSPDVYVPPSLCDTVRDATDLISSNFIAVPAKSTGSPFCFLPADAVAQTDQTAGPSNALCDTINFSSTEAKGLGRIMPSQLNFQSTSNPKPGSSSSGPASLVPVTTSLSNEAPDLRPGAIFLSDPNFDSFTSFLFSTNKNPMNAVVSPEASFQNSPASPCSVISYPKSPKGLESSPDLPVRASVSSDASSPVNTQAQDIEIANKKEDLPLPDNSSLHLLPQLNSPQSSFPTSSPEVDPTTSHVP